MKPLTARPSPRRYLFLLPVVVFGVACNLAMDPTATSQTQDDGTYDYSYQINHNGTREIYRLPRGLIVTNGLISSNPAGFNGSVLNNFNNVITSAIK